jgi:hypothetical protein
MYTFGVGLMLFILLACTKPKTSRSDAAAPTQLHAAKLQDVGFDGGKYCVQTFLEGPAQAQSLHFSNQITESDPAQKSKDFEADYAGDTVALVHRDKWQASDEDRKFFEESGKFTDPSMVTRNINNGIAEETVTNHAARSDAVGWRGVIVSIAQGGTPWSLFLSRPPVKKVGSENVSGFETIRYAIDTTQSSATDKAAVRMTTQSLKDYNITGTAWVLKDVNCVLQYSIDYDRVGQDGKVDKTHYEGRVTRK